MKLGKHIVNQVPVLTLEGRFDAHETSAVSAWLAQNTENPPAQLVINLSGVNFIDSAALSTLVQGLKRCRQRGGDLHLCALQEPVRIIFELTRLKRAFTIVDDERTAVSLFAK